MTPTTPTGIPIVQCGICDHEHPETRGHCVGCGLASAFINPMNGRCLNCRAWRVEAVELHDSPGWLAQHDALTRWNGWLCPSFDALTVVEVLGWIEETGADGSVFVAWTFDAAGALHITERDFLEEIAVDVIEPDADGLYALGAYGWCWQRQH